MDVHSLSEWLASYSAPERIGVLTLIYLRLTIHTRQLFFPERNAGNQERVLQILHGLNEIHHTLANSLSDYATEQQEARPPDVLWQQLAEIEKEYRLEHFVTPAVEYIRGHSPSHGNS
jgi:hypothetical protein